MNLTSYFFGSKTTERKETERKIYLLYGAKVSLGNDHSYVVAVFDNHELAIKELNTINEKYNLKNNVGKSIIDTETNIKEYHYEYFLVDCEINKNYEQSIENVVYGKLPY